MTTDTFQYGDTILTATNVSCVRSKRTIFSGVSLNVHSGEVIALVGPNGAGKSTLLSVLAGDLATAEGTITVLGDSLKKLSIHDLAQRRAVLTQSNHVGFDFTVSEVIEMGRAPWVCTPQADKDKEAIAEAVQAMDVEAFLPQLFNELSGGERARVSLARVLAQQTPILMLDEPTAALDIQHQERLMHVVRERAADGVGVVVVLHDLGLAAAYADTVVILADGGVVSQGTPRDVLTADRLSTVYNIPVRVMDDGAGSLQVIPDRSHYHA